MCTYGGWALVAKAAIAEGINPVVFATLRCAGGSVLMTTMLLAVPGLGFQPDKTSVAILGWRIPPIDDTRKIILVGVLQGINICCGMLAVSKLSAITVALFAPLLPVFTAILAAASGVETISIKKMVGVICSVVGAVVIIAFGEAYNTGSSEANSLEGVIFGVGCLMMNLLGSSGGVVLQKPLLRKYPPVFLVWSAYVVATVFCAIYAVTQVGVDPLSWTFYNNSRLLLCLCYGWCLTTTFNYIALAWGNKYTAPTTVTAYATLIPITTVFLSWALLGRILTPGQAVGGVVVIIGLVINVDAQASEAEIDSDASCSKPLIVNIKRPAHVLM